MGWVKAAYSSVGRIVDGKLLLAEPLDGLFGPMGKSESSSQTSGEGAQERACTACMEAFGPTRMVERGVLC